MLKNKKMHIIDKQLSNFNFYKSSNSYRELKEIIYSLLVNKELSLMPFRTGVFKEIAEEFDTTSSRLESNLSKLVDRAILNTDSKIISDGVNQNWVQKWKHSNWMTSTNSAVKNKDLWEQIENLIEQFKENQFILKFIRIRGHNGNTYNELADNLASRAAVEKSISIDNEYENQ
jgi:ribonuclease HI